MPDGDYVVPEKVPDFYLYDPSVKDFAKVISHHLDPIIWHNARVEDNTTLSEFVSEQDTEEESPKPVSSDGGKVKSYPSQARLETYLTENVAFAHHLYDLLTDHYESHKDKYFEKERLITLLDDQLGRETIPQPHEVPFQQFLKDRMDLSPDGTVEVNIGEPLREERGVREDINQELLEFFKERELDEPDTERGRLAQGDVITQDMESLEEEVFRADARYIVPEGNEDEHGDKSQEIPLPENSVDLILTSPPYWKKRQYLDSETEETELGWESTPEEFVESLVETLNQWRKFLRPTGSIFLNIGDTYHKKSLQGIPGLFENKAKNEGWIVRNEIRWTKPNGVPSPVSDRLTPRHEAIYHLVPDTDEDYFYDREAYIDLYDTGANPPDYWRISHDRNTGNHLAPFPRDLVKRVVTLACPPKVCTECGEPRRRITNQEKSALINSTDHDEMVEHLLKYEYYKLNPRRQQAQRAIKKFVESDLTFDHLRAIQAVGISDAGKAKDIQGGAGRNNKKLAELAEEAKDVLGGYFREFTFPQRQRVKWSSCECDAEYEPGTVFDPFAGSGTTLDVAHELGYNAYGTDLDPSHYASDEK